MLDFERKHQPLAPRSHLILRLVQSAAWGFAFIGVSLFIGMSGYHWLERMSWLDAFLNSSMLLAGMGPIATPLTNAGKLFAGLYALYSGFAVLIGAAIIFAPLVHRALHWFHLEEDEEPDGSEEATPKRSVEKSKRLGPAKTRK